MFIAPQVVQLIAKRTRDLFHLHLAQVKAVMKAPRSADARLLQSTMRALAMNLDPAIALQRRQYTSRLRHP
jgi:hypothetical protein